MNIEQNFIEERLADLESGNVDPLELHIQIKQMEATIKELLDNKRYREIILSEAEKNGKSFEKNGCEFSIREAGVKYDFSVCNDCKVDRLMAMNTEVGKAVKERQTFLKNIPESGLTEMDESTGEVTTIFRPSKTSTTIVAVSLK